MSINTDTWNSQILKSRDVQNNKKYYDDEVRASQYDASRLIWEDGERRVNLLQPKNSWSVLEIGPGPGVLTIPLAKKVRNITAIEPSSAMIRKLMEHIIENALDNITIIHKEWESVNEAEIERYDLVLASYCLDMTDIQKCLEKMCRASIKEVHLWWFLGETHWEKIQKEVKIQNLMETPKADILINILLEMGYHPEMEILHGTSFPNRFEKTEDAHQRIKGILNIPSGTPLPENAIAYVEKNWKNPDGTYEYDDTTTYVHITVPARMNQ
jgi:hypothetical protein